MNKKVILGIIIFSLFIMQTMITNAYNYEEVNVTTRANITNAAPEILQILIDQDITLVAGGLKTVYCNATIRDWNGYDDISSVNATFYHSTSTSESSDDGNTHYTNTSCTETSNDESFIANYSCSFQLLHYANNESWTCNISVQDTFLFNATDTNTTTINSLYALNVTDVIDYGDLAVLDYSLDVPVTVTNFGNADINISVLGYGATEGDGLGLICDAGSNITIENQKFSLATSTDWELMTSASATYQDVGLTLLQPTDGTNPVNSLIYWRLFVPPNPFGECVGTLRFTATQP